MFPFADLNQGPFASPLALYLETMVEHGVYYMSWEELCDTMPGLPFDDLKAAVGEHFEGSIFNPLYVGDGVYLEHK